MNEKIVNAIESPKELELLYQEDPKEFQQAFPDVFAQHPNSIILQVWNERLSRINEHESQQRVGIWSYNNILLVALLSLIAGTLIKLPINFEKIDTEWFYSRNLGGIFIISLMVYFLFQKPQSKKTMLFILGSSSIAWICLALLPYEYGDNYWEFRDKFRSFDDAITVAELHVPLFLWLVLGVAFAGKNWMSVPGRMDFLRYNGEVIVYTTIILIGGMVLTGITLGLLALIERTYELSEWYSENIIPYGIAAAPLVASFLIDKVIGRRLNIAPTLARIFAPLFLVTTIAYLILMAVYSQNPFDDREYLIIFNILLIVVLGLLIFSVAERDPDTKIGLSDYINMGLIVTTVVIDLVALSAVVFRMTTDIYGLTPNRTAVLGLNLLVFCHLVGILYYYARFVLKKDTFLKLENWIAKYLPAYAVWAIIISIALPLIFWYR